MDPWKTRTLFVLVIVAVVAISGILAYSMRSPTKRVQNVNNLLINGGFENPVCFQPGAGVIENASQRCTLAWDVSTNYGTVPADTVSQLTSQDPHSGSFALEFMVKDQSFPLGVDALQHLNNSGCAAGPGARFGLKMQNGLTFSFWYREVNLDGAHQSATVVFHNGTSKLAISYHLEFSNRSGYEANGLPLSNPSNEANVDVFLNSATTEWKQSTFDLYQDFVKYFGISPISNQYCVNYVAIAEGVDASSNPSGRSGAIHYCYFDDVELYIGQKP